MPELPEVESVRRSLAPILAGARVRDVRVLRRSVVVAPGDPPGGFARNPAIPKRLRKHHLLQGSTIVRLERHGKQLAIIAEDGRTVCVHLGMSGRLLWDDAPRRAAIDPHDHVVWRISRDTVSGRLLFHDPRRFGGIWLFTTPADLRRDRWSSLGPDALDIRAAALRERLANRQRAVKALLLDQAVLAGVGNIYADEALFAAGIAPTRAGRSLTPIETTRLAREIRRVLHSAIDAGGSTVRTYRGSTGQPGAYQSRHRVYGRGDLPCLRCGQSLRSAIVAARTTVSCPRCQPEPMPAG